MSVDIKFHDVKGKNYRCAIPKLNKEIVPEKCKIVVKPTKIVITLWKASSGNWLDLHYKEDKVIFVPSYALIWSLDFPENKLGLNFPQTNNIYNNHSSHGCWILLG